MAVDSPVGLVWGPLQIIRAVRPLSSCGRDWRRCASRTEWRDAGQFSGRRSCPTVSPMARRMLLPLAWALRAAGVPVWHDDGTCRGLRLGRACRRRSRGGLSGAVLVVTPELAYSTVVKAVELPRTLGLAADPAFTFSIASTLVEAGTGKLDYDASDRLLGTAPGTLRAITQYPLRTDADHADLARWYARRRLEALRPDIAAAGGELLLDVQTRVPPFAAQLDGDLVLRLRPPGLGDRRPNRAGLDDLAAFVAGLPQLPALGARRPCASAEVRTSRWHLRWGRRCRPRCLARSTSCIQPVSRCSGCPPARPRYRARFRTHRRPRCSDAPCAELAARP